VALLSGFGAGGFLNVTGHPDARATLAVVVLPDTPPSTSIADPQSQRLVTFAQQLNLAGQGTVVAGSVAGSGPGSAIDVMRNGGRAGHLSSVDNADHAVGQIVVAQALYEQLRGVSGSYGFGPGATGPGPSPAPTPPSLQPLPGQPSRPTARAGKS
jgi:Copper transport outer membrane protein, MctB